MSSFGEGEIVVNGIIVGKVRVLSVYQGQAVFPRLTLRLGVALHETPTKGFGPGRPQEKYDSGTHRASSDSSRTRRPLACST
jgi:hypothetical protein